MDDAALAKRIEAGDQSSFELLMRRHNRMLYRLARSVLRSGTDAEDALQEVYLTAYRSIGQFRGDAALSTWLSRMVINECLARVRKSARRQNVIPLVPSADIDAPAPQDCDFPDRNLMRAQMRAIIERKLDELPQDFRSVFVLRVVEELSVEETAACLNIPEATVRTRHFRARGLLRESLAREVDIGERDLFNFGGTQCDRVVAATLARLKHGP
jgi:RNA polymerase sigma-70 factor (ECF subfamily)